LRNAKHDQEEPVIYEVRDYHYRPDLFEAYKKWAQEAVPVLRKRLDVVGFWVWDGASGAEITGANTQKSPIGEANVTWIIRWESKAARDAAMKDAFAGDDWKAVWAKHPDPNGYVQMLARFMESM
jgi:hypothetical protein